MPTQICILCKGPFYVSGDGLKGRGKGGTFDSDKCQLCQSTADAGLTQWVVWSKPKETGKSLFDTYSFPVEWDKAQVIAATKKYLFNCDDLDAMPYAEYRELYGVLPKSANG